MVFFEMKECGYNIKELKIDAIKNFNNKRSSLVIEHKKSVENE